MGPIDIGSIAALLALVLVLIIFLSRTYRSHRMLNKGALTMPADFVRRCANPLFCRFDRQSRYDLEQWYESISRFVTFFKSTQADEEETPQRWMMENFHLIDMIHTTLESRLRMGTKKLPFLKSGGVCVPRIRYIAHDMLEKQMSRVRQTSIVRYLEEFQEKTPLHMNELWMLHDYLELEIIGNLKRTGMVLKNRGLKFQQIDEANEMLAAGRDMRAWQQKIEPLLMNDRDEIEAECVEYVNLGLLDLGSKAAEAMAWFDEMLVKRGYVQEKIITAAHRQRAEELILTRNAFESLKLIKEIKWSDVFEKASLVERTLLQDPGGIYPRMDDYSRVRYRERIADLAVRFGKSELYLAQNCLSFTERKPMLTRNHVGFCLFDDRVGQQWMKSMEVFGRFPLGSGRQILYFLGLFLLTAAGSAAPFFMPLPALWMRFVLAVLLIIPAYVLAGYIVNQLVSLFVHANRILRIRIDGPLPPEAKTLVVITALAVSRDNVDELAANMETAMLRNRKAEAGYALLLDLKPAEDVMSSGDEALIDYAGEKIRSLNERYGREIFYCFIRKRLEVDPATGRRMGWERKRGALMALCELLVDGESRQFMDRYRCPDALRDTQYIITLDADTRIGWGSVGELAGAMLHPLNKPEKERGRVVRGYGLLQPRVSPAIDSLMRTPFAATYAGDGGIETYAFSISNPYQDLFGIGIYTGKAIFNLPVYYQVLRDRLPDRAILSHDLLEGGYLRTGSLNDHVFVDDFPATAAEYFSRMHRWIRGDWQLLPWLMPRVRDRQGRRSRNILPGIVRWQMADNMIRSLYPAVAVPLLITGFLTGSLTLSLTAALLPIVLPQVVSALRGMMQSTIVKIKGFYRGYALKVLLDFMLLPQHAYVQMDAVVRTVIRVCFTHRNMLEWTTAHQAKSAKRGTLGQSYAGMAGGLVLTALLAAVYGLSGYPLWGIAFFALWLASPAVAYRAGREESREPEKLSPEDEFKLRRIMVGTWRYFREFTRKSTNFLPPDNYQEHPPNGLALRTSPTNIGLAVMAEVMGATIGFQAVEDTLFRLEGMMNTLESLQKWEGHLLNWYDIRDGKPLHPYYVSSVDSGNLACYLTLAARMLDQLLDQRRIGAGVLSFLLDAAAVWLDKDYQWYRQTLDELEGALNKGGLEAALDRFLPDHGVESDALETAVYEMGREWRMLWRLAEVMGVPAGDFTIRRTAEDAGEEGAEESGGMDDEMKKALRQCRAWCHRVDVLRGRMESLVSAMNFTVLYNQEKKLFHIGYDLDRDQFSNSYYDLLASEARQTSLFAIATGQVPAKHWFRMGRPSVADRQGATLKSWGGTMFEYLMPEQIFDHGQGTLLGDSMGNIVRMQKEYGQKRGVPWGISESGYYELDQMMNYQYRSFGVPGIGMKSGLIRDLVVSPYSTVMALTIDPREAWRNIQALIENGAMGSYGLYEAIDYSSGPAEQASKGRVVKSHMVHHEGMSMMAMFNYFTGGMLKKSMASIPYMGALSILLNERMLKTGKPVDKDEPASAYRNLSAACYREECPADRRAMSRSINVLSNGNYHVTIDADGSGQSRCGGTVINRWRRDNEMEYGVFLFIRGAGESGPKPHSVTMRPYMGEPDAYKSVHECGQSVFIRRDADIETRLTVFVQGNRNVEIRELKIHNQGSREAQLEVFAYTELVLNDQDADIAHPAFQNLFIETRWDPCTHVILGSRRKRSEQDRRVYLAARFFNESQPDCPVSVETTRNQALGRGHSLKNPDFLLKSWQDGSKEIPIDPVLCMKTAVSIPAGETAEIALLLGFGEEEQSALEGVMTMGSRDSLHEALELACCQVRALIRYLGVSANQLRFFNRLLPVLIRDFPLARGRAAYIQRNRLGQSCLWCLGLSGDLPIVGVEITDSSYMKGIYHLVTAHAYWRRKEIPFDLVILNRDGSDYRQVLNDSIAGMILSGVERDMLGKSGGIFIIKEEQLSEETAVLLKAVSVCWFNAEKPLTGQLTVTEPPSMDSPPVPQRPKTWEPLNMTLRPIETMYDNGYGGFNAQNREYVLHCRQNTPMPWCNVLANRDFGAILTGGGAGFVWMYNSRENKLTPWNSDPVTNPQGQGVLVRDEDTGHVWRVVDGDEGPDHRRTRFGMGYAVHESLINGFFQQERIFVPSDETVLLRLVSLHNQTRVKRRISLTVWTDFVLGVHRKHTAAHILVEPDEAGDALYARNGYRDEFKDTIAFLAVPGETCQHTCCRRLFHTENESIYNSPAMRLRDLGGFAGAGGGGFGALRFFVELEPGEEKSWTILVGGADDRKTCRDLIDAYRERSAVLRSESKTQAFWDDILERITVSTPEAGMDLMMNGWLLYQTYASRFMARAGFYQTGGAVGFRDQLQDCLVILWTRPQWVREHLLLCASHQFLDGDVQHWWHPPMRGVRTRISDDMLFLPYVVSEYVLMIDDWGVLDEDAPYLSNVEIAEGKEDYYGKASESCESGSLLDHCIRAVRRACRFGSHGLPLIGTGDWNDAMNSIGDEGRGESVWLGWFLYDVLGRMAYLCDRKGEGAVAREFEDTAANLKQALNDAGWDGQWYRRAYDDEGNPVGSSLNEDCQIDCISQSWAAISGAGEPDKVQMGMDAMWERLWSEEGQLLKLLAPPFAHDSAEPGYIKGYVPGVRENGGQYTHAAVWAVWAYTCQNQGGNAVNLMKRLMPFWHAKNHEEADRYMVEPYVTAADIYAVPPHVGRGGWTWYTGSAAWMYKITLEKILGLTVFKNHLSVNPCIPPDWKEYEIVYRYGRAVYHLHVKNPDGVEYGVRQTMLDGKVLENGHFLLVDDDMTHHVYVTMG